MSGLLHLTTPRATGASRFRAPLEDNARAWLLLERLGVAPLEVMTLVTCERLELYAVVGGDVIAATCRLRRETERWSDGPPVLVGAGEATVRHLLRVASGLESRLLGECHILGQVARADRAARAAATSGPVLRRLAEAAIRCGRRVRRETGLGTIASSYVTLAIDRVERHGRGGLVVLGSGVLARELLDEARRRGLGPLTIVARHLGRAREAARTAEASVVDLDALAVAVASAGAVVTATASPRPLLRREHIAARSRPLLVVDLSIPPNVAPDVASRAGVEHVTMHGLAARRSPAELVFRESGRRIDTVARSLRFAGATDAANASGRRAAS